MKTLSSTAGLAGLAGLALVASTLCGCFGRPSAPLVAPTYETHAPDGAAPPAIVYADSAGDVYLSELRARYPLDSVVAGATTDLERVLAVTRWTHQKWSHNGSNAPSEPNALTILAEVAEGKKYRCVEYGIVSSEALSALGIPAHVIGLTTADVATRRRGAGHVAAEAYLGDLGKWVFLDGQFDVVPFLDGVPLNAVEFAQALADRPDDVQLANPEGPLDERQRRRYVKFVGAYLYHFSVGYEQRPRTRTRGERHLVDGNPSLIIVPVGAPTPTVFQRDSPTHANYTRVVADLYAPPPDATDQPIFPAPQ